MFLHFLVGFLRSSRVGDDGRWWNSQGRRKDWKSCPPPSFEIGLTSLPKSWNPWLPIGHHGSDSPVCRSGRCKFLWRFKVYYILLIRIMRKQIRCKWRSSSRSNEGNKVMYMPQNGLMGFLKGHCKNDLLKLFSWYVLCILIDHYFFAHT